MLLVIQQAEMLTVAMDSTSAISAEMNISGTGIPANTKVLSITNSTTFEMTKNATASNTNTALTFTGALWSGVTLPTTTNWIAPGADTRAWNVIAVNWEDETREYNQFGYLGKDSGLMAVHSLTVKQIISRVRQAFPDAPENYIKKFNKRSLS